MSFSISICLYINITHFNRQVCCRDRIVSILKLVFPPRGLMSEEKAFQKRDGTL